MKLWFIVAYWFPLFFVVSVFSLLTYLSVQQSLRMGANDPQIQMAEDTVTQLNTGENVTKIIGSTKIDIGKSLAPFIVVYDKNGKAIASSGILHQQIPFIPQGVLIASNMSGENRLTWQPEVGVRIAAVVVPFTKGYVVAGRSLREIETREDALGVYIFGAWLVACVGSLVIICVFSLCGMFSKKR